VCVCVCVGWQLFAGPETHQYQSEFRIQ